MFEAQVRDLEAVGCEKVYQEQVSSVGARDELAVALDFVRERDTLVLTKLDRLARSTRHLNDIVDRLREKGSYLQVLDLGIDTAMPTGELVLTIIGGIAQFERQMMLEWQREGIAKAKAEGKYKGRKGTTEHALNDAPSGRASSPGRTSLPARSFARGQETKIAWKPPSVAVRFGETSQLGPNGEARLMLTIARSRAAPRASPKRPVNKASENSIAG
jgi:hypothetical protein